MANQALINAAQKLYSAKAQQTDITPVVQGAASITGNIMNAIAERQKQQKEEAKKTFEPFKTTLLKNDKLRAEFTTKLEDLQEEYYENQKRSENPLIKEDGDNGRKAARDRNTQIEALLSTYNNQLNKVDLNRSLDVGYSKFNKVGPLVDYTMYKDKKLVDFVKIKDDGLYFTNHEGKDVLLDKDVTLVPENTKGITNLVKAHSFARQEGSRGIGYEGTDVQDVVLNAINAEMKTNSNWKSILFDDVGTFNWVDTNLKNGSFPGSEEFFKEHGDKSLADQKEELKDLINNPEKADAFIEDFKNDYLVTVKQSNADALNAYNSKIDPSGKPKPYVTFMGQTSNKPFVQDLFNQVTDGTVMIAGEKLVRDDKDNRFYSVGANNMRKQDDAGFTEKEILGKLLIGGYVDEFNFKFREQDDRTDADKAKEKQIELIMSTERVNKEEAERLYNIMNRLNTSDASNNSEKMNKIKEALQAPNRNE